MDSVKEEYESVEETKPGIGKSLEKGFATFILLKLARC